MNQTWLVDQWVTKFTEVLKSMVDEDPTLTWSAEGSDELGSEALLMDQKFVPSPEPLVWVGVPDTTWRDLGGRVLKGAGVESVADQECRNTCLELLQQATGGLGQLLSARLQQDVAGSGSSTPASFPQGLHPIRVSIQYGDTQLQPILIAFAPLLLQWLEKGTSAPAEPAAEERRKPGIETPISRTFDLLLDVALPVSISFGRTELAIKEVLKLTTGSIVELNRGVSEPVEVIVNNCVIARGEVVVVEGNYGVRIHQIVSRQERLRTGTTTPL